MISIIYLLKFLEEKYLVKKFMKMINFFISRHKSSKKNSCLEMSLGEYIDLDNNVSKWEQF